MSAELSMKGKLVDIILLSIATVDIVSSVPVTNTSAVADTKSSESSKPADA